MADKPKVLKGTPLLPKNDFKSQDIIFAIMLVFFFFFRKVSIVEKNEF